MASEPRCAPVLLPRLEAPEARQHHIHSRHA